jgi:hypothetical protein
MEEVILIDGLEYRINIFDTTTDFSIQSLMSPCYMCGVKTFCRDIYMKASSDVFEICQKCIDVMNIKTKECQTCKRLIVNRKYNWSNKKNCIECSKISKIKESEPIFLMQMMEFIDENKTKINDQSYVILCNELKLKFNSNPQH